MRNPNERRLFLMPATIFVLVLTIFPILFSIGLSLTNYRLLGQNELRFIWFGNWGRLMHDHSFWLTMRNTVVFVTAGVILQYFLGLAVALLLHQEPTLHRFFRVSFLIPMMMSPVAISYIIGKMMFNSQLGPLYDIARRLGFHLADWTTSPAKAMGVLVLADTWQWTPFYMLALLAALQTIPTELNEAARVDGASGWDIFRYITFPLLMPISTTIILIRSLEAFKVIDIVRVVTGGGPGQATESVTLLAYDLGIKNGDMGYAAAIAFTLLFIVILFATAFLAVARRVTPQQG